MKISARNVFPGVVTALTTGAVNTEVGIEIAPGLVITAVITRGSAEHLGLVVGGKALAVVKASNVLVATE